MSSKDSNLAKSQKQEQSTKQTMFTALSEGVPDPFELKIVFGFKKHIGVRLYKNNQNELNVIYCMSNIINIYNTIKNNFQHLTGHPERVTQIELDRNGRILISVDTKSIFIWDLKCPDETEPTILRVFNEPFGKNITIMQAAISPCGKYLIIVSNADKFSSDRRSQEIRYKEKRPLYGYRVQFWAWSYDREVVDDTYELADYGTVKQIVFSCNKGEENFFAISFSQTVLFGTIEKSGENNYKLLFHIPESKKFKEITQTCYIENSRYVISGTTNGYLIIWDDFYNEIFRRKVTNEKNLLKVVPLKPTSINDVKCFDGYIVTGDDTGEIRFYDSEIRLVFVCTSNELNVNEIWSIWPNKEERKFRIDGTEIEIVDEEGGVKIPIAKCPVDCSLNKKPFTIRNFFLVNQAGQLYLIDIVKRIYKTMLLPSEDYYVAFDLYPQRTFMVGCTRGGWIIICNYETKNIIAKYFFEPKERPKIDKQDKNKIKSKQSKINEISFCKVAHNEMFIALGYENGNIWMIDPISAKPTHEYAMSFTEHAIRKIVFKETNHHYCVVTDDKYNLIYIHYDGNNWILLAKLRYHCLPILAMFFLRHEKNEYLVTIGNDRMYVKYDISDSKNPLIPLQDIRLDQTPKITAAKLLDSNVLSYNTSKSGKVIMIANSHFKFVFYDALSAENLFTFLGPIFESPIQKIIYCKANETFKDGMFLFVSNKTMGAALNPIDGNPFRYSGILAHHTKINSFNLTWDKSKVVIHGDKDTGASYWEIKKENILRKFECGGDGLEPFCKTLPGGKTGAIFKEMQQFFYYMQLMADETDANEKRTITEYLKISEIVDFMRAVGYFPSEYEIKNLINQVTRTKDSWAAPPTHISFSDLIKLYINHRPYDGYKFSEILESLKFQISGRLRFAIYEIEEMKHISLQQIYDMMTSKAEQVTQTQAMRYLIELLDREDRGIKKKVIELTDDQVLKIYKNLPKRYDINEFCYKVFGMDPTDGENLINLFEKMSSHSKTDSTVDQLEEEEKDDQEDCVTDDEINEEDYADSDPSTK